MAFRRRQSTPEKQASTTITQQRIKSRLLPKLFADIDERQHIQVLDLGAGSNATLSFFGQLGTATKITFADTLDLCDELAPLTDQAPFDFIHAVQTWQRHLGLQPQDQIDYLLAECRIQSYINLNVILNVILNLNGKINRTWLKHPLFKTP